MNNILCLDLGSVTGWAYVSFNGTSPKTLLSGTWDFRPRRFDGAGMRYVKFRNCLLECLSQQPVEAVFFEEVRRHMGADAARVYGALFGIVTALCEERGIPYEGIPVGTLKRYWTGKGSASKRDMIAAAESRGYKVADDNEADAIALAYLALHRWQQDPQESVK